ncbi:30S ribosomal protein S17, chloroplastic isoform X1 [Zea mays]|uniref:30S ribosomal protein S17 n=1 Tax=Zea mays TaxID=4577 RepID=A0A1D6KNQ4_MAIZE|nr:30S ribosomal protein S17, chloroplastic isoform X1 [Zea mays]ONM04442.1 30S ribosomal protein S17 [Zea mays]|eukprot:XP_020402251.1 30S ribosomal protein S17, chloroplastic isoform X1 [Zea mays]
MEPVVGIVVSNKMQKSVVVAVDRLFHYKMYNRYVKRTSKFMAHDEADSCNIGDRVVGWGLGSRRAAALGRCRDPGWVARREKIPGDSGFIWEARINWLGWTLLGP